MQDRGSCGGGTYRHVVSWNFTDSDNIYTSLDQVWTMKLMHMVKIIITRINKNYKVLRGLIFLLPHHIKQDKCTNTNLRLCFILRRSALRIWRTFSQVRRLHSCLQKSLTPIWQHSTTKKILINNEIFSDALLLIPSYTRDVTRVFCRLVICTKALNSLYIFIMMMMMMMMWMEI